MSLMNSPTAKKMAECPRAEIVAYIDGDLSPREEIELEKHFAVCCDCAEELNEQKKLLQALDFGLEDEEDFEIPEDFTKIVVANAQSNVSGLRQPSERFNALLICSALLLFVLLGLGSETGSVFQSVGKLFEQVLAIAGFFAHLAYDVAVGAVVIVRSLSFQFVFKSFGSLAAVGFIFSFSVLLFLRLMFRHSNAFKGFRA